MKPLTTTYRAVRLFGDVVLYRITPMTIGSAKGTATASISPKASQKLWNHSPDGFNFGYGGSGPAQLALAIMLDFLEDSEQALQWYQRFKWHHIAAWHSDNASIGGQQIVDFLQAEQQAEEA